jgi:hypothetical protein
MSGVGWVARLFTEADKARAELGEAYEQREREGDSDAASMLNDFMGVLDDLFLRCGGSKEIDTTQFAAPGNFETDSKPCPGCPDCAPQHPVEGREEQFRVFEDFKDFERIVRVEGDEYTASLTAARTAAGVAETYADVPVRIQRRTVTETEWEDVPDE